MPLCPWITDDCLKLRPLFQAPDPNSQRLISIFTWVWNTCSKLTHLHLSLDLSSKSPCLPAFLLSTNYPFIRFRPQLRSVGNVSPATSPSISHQTIEFSLPKCFASQSTSHHFTTPSKPEQLLPYTLVPSSWMATHVPVPSPLTFTLTIASEPPVICHLPSSASFHTHHPLRSPQCDHWPSPASSLPHPCLLHSSCMGSSCFLESSSRLLPPACGPQHRRVSLIPTPTFTLGLSYHTGNLPVILQFFL